MWNTHILFHFHWFFFFFHAGLQLSSLAPLTVWQTADLQKTAVLEQTPVFWGCGHWPTTDSVLYPLWHHRGHCTKIVSFNTHFLGMQEKAAMGGPLSCPWASLTDGDTANVNLLCYVGVCLRQSPLLKDKGRHSKAVEHAVCIPPAKLQQTLQIP